MKDRRLRKNKKLILYPLIAFVVVFTFHAIYSTWQGARAAKQWIQVEGITPLSVYWGRLDYFLGLSYALAGAFTIYALLKFLESRRNGVTGVVGGLTLAGILYLGGCFLLGCCGSPMLVVYLSLFGSSLLGFTKPLILVFTMTSIVLGYFWIDKKAKTSSSCCIGKERGQ